MVAYNQDEIKRKQSLLQVSRDILKKEFVGIDTVIDKVMDSINTWFIFPEFQETPLVINLWGMTGIGKTALITRLSELLEFNKKFFRYDMGNNSDNSESLKDNLEIIFEYNNGMPCMIVLDEFQYAKTKNDSDSEIDNHYTRIVWDLLDSGKIQAIRYRRAGLEKIATVKNLLSDALDAGVKIKNGIVIENETTFLELVNSSADSECEMKKTNT